MRKQHLVLEGRDEWHLLKALPEPIRLAIHDVADQNIKPTLGDGIVSARLAAALKESDPGVILVICDAESRPAHFIWQKLKQILERFEFEDLPESLPGEGLIRENSNEKRVGIWVMPDNSEPGMIEDFYLSAIPETDRERKLAQGFVGGIENPRFARKTATETEKVKRKAVLGVWLAIQRDPLSAREALERKVISMEAGSFPPLLQFLRDLLIDAPEAEL